jgi:hypothetical protein
MIIVFRFAANHLQMVVVSMAKCNSLPEGTALASAVGGYYNHGNCPEKVGNWFLQLW